MKSRGRDEEVKGSNVNGVAVGLGGFKRKEEDPDRPIVCWERDE